MWPVSHQTECYWRLNLITGAMQSYASPHLLSQEAALYTGKCRFSSEGLTAWNDPLEKMCWTGHSLSAKPNLTSAVPLRHPALDHLFWGRSCCSGMAWKCACVSKRRINETKHQHLVLQDHAKRYHFELFFLVDSNLILIEWKTAKEKRNDAKCEKKFYCLLSTLIWLKTEERKRKKKEEIIGQKKYQTMGTRCENYYENGVDNEIKVK